MKRLQLTIGQRFGKLLVESSAGSNKHKKASWNCLCDCGNRVVYAGTDLKNGKSTSCGRCPNRTEPFGNAIVIWLEYKGYEKPCFIDAADYPLVKDYRWCADQGDKTFYAQNSRLGVYIQEIITGGKGTDHIDGDGLNNRRENLRAASRPENMQNMSMKANNTSGFKGVRRLPSKRFTAQIRANKKRYCLGTFKTALEAARAYNAAALKYHGEFAVLNDVGDHDLILNQKPEAQP